MRGTRGRRRAVLRPKVALDDAGDLRLLTDGQGLFLQTRQGHVFDLLVDPMQALLGSDALKLRPVTGRAKRRASARKPRRNTPE